MISIIIPTYNNSNQLIKTISNVFLQDINDIEIILIDDASSDDTELKIKALNNSKIKYFKHSRNMGVTFSRVEGIKKSSGQYVGFLDDDDIWLNNKLKKQLELIIQKKLDFIMSDYIVNNTIDNIQYVKSLKDFGANFKNNIIKKPGPFFQCCLFKKDFLIKHIDKFDSKSEPSEDWDFFISISKSNPKVYNIDESMFQWNLSSQSQTANSYNESCAIEYIIKKHKKYIVENTTKSALSLHYRKLGSMFFYSDKFDKSKYYYNKAFKNSPLSLKNIVFQIVYLFPEIVATMIISLLTTKMK